ncbi:MAG TPA: hypothetical protein VNT30_19805 [Stellaceae bacterium]|nr:hypothetical protein [Stellaceae bacterium]
MLNPDVTASPGAGILDLSYGEHLLVWTLRRVIVGGGESPLIRREFADAFGDEAEAALIAFHSFIVLLNRDSRRRFSIGHPGCAGLTFDERHLLTVVATAQHEADARLDAQLRWLVRREGQDDLRVAVTRLARLLGEHSIDLPLSWG